MDSSVPFASILPERQRNLRSAAFAQGPRSRSGTTNSHSSPRSQISCCDGWPVGPPSVARHSLVVLDSDWHLAQALGEANLRSNRPPVVEEHLQRSPHCHPPNNEKPFAD